MKQENYNRIITNENAPDKTRMAYVRCSTVEQNEARQLEALKDYHIYKIFVEKASAKDTSRPMFKQLLDFLREGDSLYVKDFSRVARSTKDLLLLTEELDNRKIRLISLKEQLDTSTPTGKLLLTMIGAIYEFERSNLLERQREGIRIAQRNGKYKGSRKIDKPDNWDAVYALYKTRQITALEAMKSLCLKKNTFYNFVNAEKR